MANLVFITGGARSGKSRFAEELAASLGSRVVYIATGRPVDKEMEIRIALHKGRRPQQWNTVEAPLDVASVIEDATSTEVILVDCLTLLVSNLLLEKLSSSGHLSPGAPIRTQQAQQKVDELTLEDLSLGVSLMADGTVADPGQALEIERSIIQEVERVICASRRASREAGTHVIIVSNEVGLGLVPEYPLGRIYRDILGRANQMVATAADEVYVLWSGIPVEIKGPNRRGKERAPKKPLS